MPAKQKLNPALVNWAKKDITIARELDVSPTTVMLARQRAGKAKVQARTRLDWSSVDWSMDNAQLVRLLGCGHSAVMMARRKHGKGEKPLQQRIGELSAWLDGLGSRLSPPVRDAEGGRVSTAQRLRMALEHLEASF